jgi:prepilin peptidase CpaA
MMSNLLNLVFAGGFTFLVVLAVVSDARQLVIPNWISLSLVGAFAAYAMLVEPMPPVLAHIGVALAVFAVGVLLFVVRWFAAGDVKLLAAVALWAGPSASLWLVTLTTLLGALLAIGVLGARWLDNYGEAIGMPSGLRWLLPRWARHGLCPYGVAIGAAALLTVPAQML